MLKYDVNVSGEPPPTIEWRFGGSTLKSGRTVSIDNSDYNTKLVIRPVKREDSGEYTVTATNSSGKDSVTVMVTVTDKPSAPEGPLQVCDVTFPSWKTSVSSLVIAQKFYSFRCLMCTRKVANSSGRDRRTTVVCL